METSRNFLETGLPAYARTVEQQIEKQIEDLERQIGQVAQASGNNSAEARSEGCRDAVREVSAVSLGCK